MSRAGELDITDTEALLAFHRAVFGSAVMEADGDDGADGEDGADDGADGADDGDGDGEDGADDGEDGDAGKLGEAGKRALAKERARRKSLEGENRRLKAATATADEAASAAKLEERDAHWKPLIIKTAAKAALATAGASKGIDRLAKLIDLSEVDVDEDGDVEGLDEQIEALKTEYPELFGVAAEEELDENGEPKRKPGRLDTSGGTGRRKKLTSADKLTAALTGKSA